MSARDVTRSPSGQGTVIWRLKSASCSRIVLMRCANHAGHVFLGTPHLFGLSSLGNRRVMGALGVHLRLIARRRGWHLPVAQGHRAVQMNFGNSGLHRYGSNLFPALHGLRGRRTFGSQSIPSGPGDISSSHAAQRVINRITWNPRRVNLCASREIVILTFVSVQAHFLCSGIFTFAKADTQSQPQTSNSCERALACETLGGVVASAFLRRTLAQWRCCL